MMLALVGDPIFAGFATLGLTRRTEAAAARDEADHSRAECVSWLSALQLQEPTPAGQPYAGQIDMHRQAKLVLVAHMCNPYVRRLLWPQEAGDLEALLARSPLVASFGMVRSPDAGWLRADFWPRFFALVRLPRHQLDLEAESLVLATEQMLLRDTSNEKRTVEFVRFYKRLVRRFPPAWEDAIRRDLLLLYFVATCLLEKNGLEVLRLSYHMGPVLKHYDQLLRHDSLYDVGSKNPDSALVFYAAMREFAPQVCEGDTGATDYMVALGHVMETWNNLLASLEVDLPARYQEPKVMEIAQLTEAVSGAVAAAGPEPETPGEPVAQTEEPVAPAEESAEGIEAAAMQYGPAPQPNNARIGAPISGATSVCASHASGRRAAGYCPVECVQARIGAELPYALPERALQSPWLHCMKSRAGDASRAQLIAATIVASVTPQTPQARRAVLIAHGLTERQIAAVQPAQGTNDWLDAISGLQTLQGQSDHGLDEIDALASRCGWAQAPVGERIARFATLYGAPSVAGAFSQSRWVRTASIDAEMAAFKREHPVVQLSTLQVIAAAAMAARD